MSMSTERVFWAIIFLIAITSITYRAANGRMGKAYVKQRTEEVIIEAGPLAGQTVRDVREVNANPNEPGAQVSMPRTIGLWVSAFFTLCILSFLYRDNPFYKFAEAVVVGVSAGYWMVIGFWNSLVPNLLANLWPDLVQAWAMPGLKEKPEYLYVIPLILGVLLLCRLLPKGGWISRWAIAFFIGTFAGLRLMGFLQGEFVAQIGNTIQSAVDHLPYGRLTVGDVVKTVLLIVGVLSGLTYFFFSFEHKGFVGKVSKVGIWFLMITFGAAFGYTVMGRIALLAIRVEFLVDDWLWLIDPRLVRAGMPGG